MPALPEQVSEAWGNRKGPAIFTTVAEDGTPNSIWVGCLEKCDEERLMVADNYFHKTRQEQGRSSLDYGGGQRLPGQGPHRIRHRGTGFRPYEGILRCEAAAGGCGSDSRRGGILGGRQAALISCLLGKSRPVASKDMGCHDLLQFDLPCCH